MRIGLALGSGGSRGLAHIPVLAAFEEMGLTPHTISGASMGAVIGALYASGLTAAELREGVEDLLGRGEEGLADALFRKETLKMLDFLDPTIKRGGMMKGERFLAFLMENMPVDTFEELAIPLKVVACDFWRREQLVFDTGPLAPALKASMAIPAFFTPVEADGRVLVDGGLVNPVPYDLLLDECDMVVAVDVLGPPSPPGDRPAGPIVNVLQSIRCLQSALAREKRVHRPPDIYLMAGLEGVRIFDFHKASRIFARGELAAKELKAGLSRLLARGED